MGYAVRTARYRYVEWREWKSGTIEARELYDHEGDPNEIAQYDATMTATTRPGAGATS